MTKRTGKFEVLIIKQIDIDPVRRTKRDPDTWEAKAIDRCGMTSWGMTQSNDKMSVIKLLL